MLKKLCEWEKEDFGVNHAAYARALNNLAELYRAQGRHDEAEPLHDQAKEIWRTALGEDHPPYATSLNNLRCCIMTKGGMMGQSRFISKRWRYGAQHWVKFIPIMRDRCIIWACCMWSKGVRTSLRRCCKGPWPFWKKRCLRIMPTHNRRAVGWIACMPNAPICAMGQKCHEILIR